MKKKNFYGILGILKALSYLPCRSRVVMEKAMLIFVQIFLTAHWRIKPTVFIHVYWFSPISFELTIPKPEKQSNIK